MIKKSSPERWSQLTETFENERSRVDAIKRFGTENCNCNDNGQDGRSISRSATGLAWVCGWWLAGLAHNIEVPGSKPASANFFSINLIGLGKTRKVSRIQITIAMLL